MRITKSGQRHKTDWDAADHDRAGHPQTLPPLALARHNIEMALISLGVAERCDTGQPAAHASIEEAIRALEAALELL